MPAKKHEKVLTVAGRPVDILFRTLIRTFGLVERVMQAHFARFGISGAQWGILRNLYQAEKEGLQGLRLTDLSTRLLIRPPSVTGAVDRLERADLVEARGLMTDLRAKPVGLTEKGRNLVECILAVHEAQIDAVLDCLSASEQAELGRILGRLGEHLGELLERRIGTKMA